LGRACHNGGGAYETFAPYPTLKPSAQPAKKAITMSGMCLNFYDLIATRYRQEKSRRKLAGLVCGSYLYGCPAWGAIVPNNH